MRAFGITVLVIILTGFTSAEQGLVADYHFDGDANDSSGNENNGTIYGGAAFVDGVSGQALSFDGVDDYVNVSDAPTLDLTTALTIEAWIKPEVFPQEGGAPILAKGTGGGGEVYGFDFPSLGNLRFYVWYGSLYNCAFADWLTTSKVNNLSHVVVTYNSGTVKIYDNANLIKTCTDFPTSLNTNNHELTIGSRQSGNTIYDMNFKGLIDEVRVYNRALSTEEIRQNYEQFTLSNSGNGAWQHNRDLTITNPGISLNYYQTLVNLSDVDFPIEANASGDDIRFTDSSGELPYWIENWDFANRSGKVWVNVTNIPAGASKLRMWYGNPNATSSSNGTNTFLFFDDFEGTALKPQWTWTTTGDGNVTVANDLADYYQGSSSQYYTELYGSNHILPSTDIVYTVRSRLSTINSLEGYMVIVENTSHFHFGIQARTYWDNQFHGCFGNTRCDLETNVPLNVPIDTDFHVFDTIIFDGKANFYVDKVYRNQISGNLIGNLRPFLYTDLADGNHLYIDYVRVRKYAYSEPSVNLIGYINGTVQNNSAGIAGAIVTTNTGINATTNAVGFYSMLLTSGEYNLTAVSEPIFYINSSITATVVAGTTLIQDIELLKKPTGNISGSVSVK